MASRQHGNSIPIGIQVSAGTDEQCTSPALDECCKGFLDVEFAPADIENDELLANRKRRSLHVASLRLSIGTVRVPSTRRGWIRR